MKKKKYKTAKHAPIILASTSPRRKQLLAEYGIKFRIIPPHADEEKAIKKLKKASPEKVACELALLKADSVAISLGKGLVLGADTIVVLGKDIIGKPRSDKDALRILSRLSGSTHRVITGIALIDSFSGRTIVDHETTHVTFKKVKISVLEKYISENHVMDKAGAYAVQENSDPFIMKINGSYSNVVGLPMELLARKLKNF